MADALHRSAKLDDIHQIHAWDVADIAERDFLSLADDDVGKVCRVNGNEFYVLADSSPATWVAVAGAVGATGATGPQGITGATGTAGGTGSIGPQGVQGIQGPVGVTGPQGITGAAGSQGIGVQFLGSVADEASLPSTGNTMGDSYIVDADGNLWTWDGSGWLDVGQIVGAVGPQGIQGIQGTQGIQGATGLQGVTGPQGATGSAGSNGTDGATGPTGADGIDGTDGADGATGPAGQTGATGTFERGSSYDDILSFDTGFAKAVWGSTTVSTSGFPGVTSLAAGSTRGAPTGTPPDYFDRSPRIHLFSGATAGEIVEVRANAGALSHTTGFVCNLRARPLAGDASSARWFMGVKAGASADASNEDVLAQADFARGVFGLARVDGSANAHIVYTSDASTVDVVDLGGTFPALAGAAYDVRLKVDASNVVGASATVAAFYTITRLDDLEIATGTVELYLEYVVSPRMWVSNNADTEEVGLDWSLMAFRQAILGL
jgi:hypothetical protein